MILLIGSDAARRHMADMRIDGDIDLIMEMPDLLDFVEDHGIDAAPFSKTKFVGKWCGTMVEMEVAWPGSCAEMLLDRVTGKVIKMMGQNLFLPDLNWLYTIKMSHRYLKNSPHFRKTMDDVHAMRKAGAQIADEEWLAAREAETYSYATPKLDVSKEHFFAEGARQFPHDHDSVHWAVKTLGEKPAYLHYKADDKEVWCDKEKWDACAESTKQAGVIEECYVLAIERCLVPHPGKVTPETAFLLALEKVCTSITSGYFREYAWDNYDKIVAAAPMDYFQRFQMKLANKEVALNPVELPAIPA